MSGEEVYEVERVVFRGRSKRNWTKAIEADMINLKVVAVVSESRTDCTGRQPRANPILATPTDLNLWP